MKTVDKLVSLVSGYNYKSIHQYDSVPVVSAVIPDILIR